MKTKTDKKAKTEKMSNTIKEHDVSPAKPKKQKLKILTDWDWTVLVAAWRYYEHRATIASAMFPAEMVERFFSGEYQTEDEMRIARQFAEIDHGLRGASDWDSAYDCDRCPWQKFYYFCRAYCDGFTDIELIDGSTVTAFYNVKSERWIPRDSYIRRPYAEIFISPEAIVKTKEVEDGE